MSRVYAVVVTYNRSELLERCVSALQRQTCPLDGIIVVDNASTDATAAYLVGLRDPKLTAWRLSENTGGAGGFNTGMRLAYGAGADSVWLMDDDVVPEPDALERLVQAGDALGRRGAPYSYLVSTAWTPEGSATNVPDVDHRANALQYENWPAHLDLAAVAVRRATFVAVLFPRPVIARHGLPIAPMFIWGDDTEYTVRVSRDAPGYLVGTSRVLHVRAAPGQPSLATETNPVRMRFHRFMTRNMLYHLKRHFGLRAALRYGRYQAGAALRLALSGQGEKAAVLARGCLDGLTFRPVIEAADTPHEGGALSHVDLVRLG